MNARETPEPNSVEGQNGSRLPPITENLEEGGRLLPADAIEAAESAGLYYVMDGEPGYTRRKRGKQFVYLDPQGNPVTSARLLARFHALVIPPAWSEVWICRRTNGHIQATGRDAKGRKQYRYHEDWSNLRSLTKFERIVQFGEALPAIRAQIAADLRSQQLAHRKVSALVVRLLDQTLIRVGNQEYARQNSSYGLTTLLDDHIIVNGSRLMMTFVGKRGKQFAIDLRDRRLAGLVKRCQDLPGQRLFQYLDENGQCCQSISSGDVNQYLRDATGQEFSAKDFRTWGGTVIAATELYQAGPAEDEKEGDRQIARVVKIVAQALGNTPAICRKYYIHPLVLDAYRTGALFEVINQALQRASDQGADGLTLDEQAVLCLFKGGALADRSASMDH